MSVAVVNALAPSRLSQWEDDVNLELRDQASKWHVRCVDEVSSTMDYARLVLPQLDGNNFGLVLAQHQSRGRGRQSRQWESTDGSMYLTLIILTEKSGAHLSGFSLCAGIAIRRVCESLGATAKLKWPNDILSEAGEKVGGILIENFSHQRGVAMLVGIGVNLLAKPKSIDRTTSLYELSGTAHEAPLVAGQIARTIGEVWPTFLDGGFEKFRSEWLNHCLALGKEVKVRDGDREVKGILSGVAPDGALLLDQGGNEVRIVVGDVLVGN